MSELFFNLDLDSSKTVIEKQITKIPDFNFKTSEKADTVWLVGTNSYYTFPRSTVFGMPCFTTSRTSEDQFKPDSLKIFLGGGNGIISLNHHGDSQYNSKNTKTFTIETVEIIRNFTEEKSADAAYDNICAALKELCSVDIFVNQTEIEGKRYWSFPVSMTEEEAEIYYEKRINVDFYPPSEENQAYTVKLSYSKSLWNGNTI